MREIGDLLSSVSQSFLIKVYKKSSSHFFQIRAFWQSSTKGLSCPDRGDRLDENPDRMDFFGPEYSDLIFGPVLTFVRIFEKKRKSWRRIWPRKSLRMKSVGYVWIFDFRNSKVDIENYPSLIFFIWFLLEILLIIS